MVTLKGISVALLGLISFLGVASTENPNRKQLSPAPTQLEEIIYSSATTTPEWIDYYVAFFDASSTLVHAIAQAESPGYVNQCNQKYGCIAGIGPLQFVWSTWKENCEGNVLNPHDNVRCGVKLIAQGKLCHWKQSAWKWDPNKAHTAKCK